MELQFVIGRDNTQKIKLFDDSTGSMAAANLGSISRVILSIGDVDIDSTDDVGYFDYDDGDGTITIDIGAAPDLVEGIFDSHITLFDATQPNGIRWTPNFKVRILTS